MYDKYVHNNNCDLAPKHYFCVFFFFFFSRISLSASTNRSTRLNDAVTCVWLCWRWRVCVRALLSLAYEVFYSFYFQFRAFGKSSIYCTTCCKQKKTCWGWSAHSYEPRNKDRSSGTHYRAKSFFLFCLEFERRRGFIFFALDWICMRVCECECLCTLKWQKFEGGHNHVI